jgi:cytochrome c oxidase subunit IV
VSTDPHSHAHGDHPSPTFKLYMAVALALAVVTCVSFAVNGLVTDKHLSPFMGFVIIMGVAVLKAVLVGMYFMHLKYDWGRLYFMIIPAFILATMFLIVLLPDIVVAWHIDQYEVKAPVSSQH